MRLPFIKDDTKDVERKKFHKRIQEEAWTITKLAMTRKLKQSHIDKLERMYKAYYHNYPDEKAKKESEDRINKLRLFAKGDIHGLADTTKK